MLQKKFHPFHIKDKAQKYKKKQCVFYFKKSVFLQPQIGRGVAQLVARYVRDVEVPGSNPGYPT